MRLSGNLHFSGHCREAIDLYARRPWGPIRQIIRQPGGPVWHAEIASFRPEVTAGVLRRRACGYCARISPRARGEAEESPMTQTLTDGFCWLEDQPRPESTLTDEQRSARLASWARRARGRNPMAFDGLSAWARRDAAWGGPPGREPPAAHAGA